MVPGAPGRYPTMDDVRIESDEPRSGNLRADPGPPTSTRDDSPPVAVLAYRAPHEEPPGPTVMDIFKGTAAVALMLLFLSLALCVSVLLVEQWKEGAANAAAAPAAVMMLLLLGAWLSFRGARDCFTGAIRRNAIRRANDPWSKS
jgi:hypothetical protein